MRVIFFLKKNLFGFFLYLEDGSCRPRRVAAFLPAPLQRAGRPVPPSRCTVQNCSKCCQAIHHAVVCSQANKKGINEKIK